jgi:putative alpha-1,2-mannosidase
MKNLRAEIPHWDFDRTKREGQAAWNRELSKIAVTADSRDDLVNFYTALYHTFLSPTVYMDVDGSYKGLDQNVHRAVAVVPSPIGPQPPAKGVPPRRPLAESSAASKPGLNGVPFTNYTTFSLWDTYRALHPFLNIVQPSRNRDMVRSMLAHYDQSVHHMLPVWSHYANENWCMIGYHSVSVIADAVVTGNLTGPEANKALDAAVQTARTKYYDGLEYYMNPAMCRRTKILPVSKRSNTLMTIGLSPRWRRS